MTITTSMDDIADRDHGAFWRRRDVRHVARPLGRCSRPCCVVFGVFVPARLMGPPASPTMHAVESTMTRVHASRRRRSRRWSGRSRSTACLRGATAARGQPETDGPALRTNRPAAVLWILLSSVLCVFLLVWGLAEIGLGGVRQRTKSDAMVVNVTGQQWVWTFSYPRSGVQSDQLYLPVDRPVVFHVTSKDVVHSFWVVQMGIKIDANPGAATTITCVPNKLGTFDVRCAELCGLLHADMETSAHVVSAADFGQWLTANGGHAR